VLLRRETHARSGERVRRTPALRKGSFGRICAIFARAIGERGDGVVGGGGVGEGAVEGEAAGAEEETSGAETAGGSGVVADVEEGDAPAEVGVDAIGAAGLEARVADGESLVDEEDVGEPLGGHGEAEAGDHARGVVLEGAGGDVGEFGEVEDGVGAATGLGGGNADEDGGEDDVLAAGEFGIEAGAEFEKGRDAAADQELALGGREDACDELEEGALAGAVSAEDGDGLPSMDIEGDAAEGPEGAGGRTAWTEEVGEALGGAAVGCVAAAHGVEAEGRGFT